MHALGPGWRMEASCDAGRPGLPFDSFGRRVYTTVKSRLRYRPLEFYFTLCPVGRGFFQHCATDACLLLNRTVEKDVGHVKLSQEVSRNRSVL